MGEIGGETQEPLSREEKIKELSARLSVPVDGAENSKSQDLAFCRLRMRRLEQERELYRLMLKRRSQRDLDGNNGNKIVGLLKENLEFAENELDEVREEMRKILAV